MFNPTKDILGDDFKGIDARVGDAAALPFRDEEFDLLVSIRFLRDIVTFDIAKQVMGEFSRICKKYAIIQLGQNAKMPKPASIRTQAAQGAGPFQPRP